MPTQCTDTLHLRRDLQYLLDGDSLAAERLIEHAYGQLQRMAANMLQSFPVVRRWEDTDDVWLVSAFKFHRALVDSPPESVQHFFNLAGTQIRRTLIDLARKHRGPCGLSANHESRYDFDSERNEHGVVQQTMEPADNRNDPLSLAEWEQFHCDVEQLPDDAREVFNLLWYGGLTQEEASLILRLHVRSIKRRWRQARVLLYQRREGAVPN